MIEKIFSEIVNNLGKSAFKVGSKTVVKAVAKRTATSAVKSGAHKKAISEGLRLGSSEAAKVMAKWRWK